MSDKRRSRYWDYFTTTTAGSPIAQGRKCKANVKGKTPKDFSTTPLTNHLRVNHPEVITELEKE